MSSRKLNPSPLLFSLGLALAASGCLPGLSLTAESASTAKPSNVAVYFSADSTSGKPEAALTAEDFVVFENGTRVGYAEGRQVLLKPAAVHYTLFLVDLSGKALGAKEAGEVIKDVSALASGADRNNRVAVYTFDGSPDLENVLPFTATDGAKPTDTAPAPRERKGPAIGLESGTITALHTLSTTLASDPTFLKSGAVVVFTDTTSRADRMRPLDWKAALGTPDNRKLDLFAVGVGPDVDDVRLSALGKTGTVVQADAANIHQAFLDAEAKVTAAFTRYYLLSYCSPARAGLQDVRIETHAPDGLMGELGFQFNADGFAPGCDPNAPPGVAIVHAEEAPPPKKVEPPKKPHHTHVSPPPSEPEAPAPSHAHPSASPPVPSAPPAADPFAP